MLLRQVSLFVLSLTLSSLAVSAQTKTLSIPKPTPPGNIQLLDGYKYEQLEGIDSYVGVIKGENGLEIRHDIGNMAGNYTRRYLDSKVGDVVWIKRQTLNNDDVLVVLLKNGHIIANYTKSSANFFASTSKQEEIVDFMLIVMTYKP